MGIHALMFPPNSAYYEIEANSAASRDIQTLDFRVDVMFVSGRILIGNKETGPIPVGTATEYEVAAPDNSPITQTLYDFDNDGKPDTSTLGEMVEKTLEDGSKVKVFEAKDDGTLQAVYFSSRKDANPEEPDVIRQADTKKNFQANGLLKSISRDDFKKTDILVFRESTGQLVLERRGMSTSDMNSRDADVAKDNAFYYRLMLRGPTDNQLNIGGGITRNGSWEEWSSQYKMTEPFQKREADHLKSGEWIRVVAINRATGYMATQRVQLSDASQNDGGFLNVPLQDMTLMPPNLKVWAERSYDVDDGLTQGEDRHYLIGAEGAALTSDTYIRVYTEWLDEEGRALPEDLGKDNGEQYGLTGRLAKVVAENVLTPVSGFTSTGSDLANFPIAPGRNTQVLRLNDNLTTPEHFYIHVSGTQKDESPDFGTSPEREGILATRPKNVTPFLTPLYDENKNWKTWNAYRDLKREQASQETPVPEDQKPIKPLPTYVWGYRPEYQFSQYQLELDEINRVTLNAQGQEEKTNLLDSKTPLISSTDELIEILYSLFGNDNPRLDPIDGPKDLVLALGEEELKLELGEDKQIRFDNIEHLASLTPEDFLTLRLYTNQDAGNILWEYAFEYLVVDSLLVDADAWTGECLAISADDTELDLYSNILGYSSRSEKSKSNYVIQWSVEGNANLTNRNTPVDENGFAYTTLKMLPVAGNQASVTAKIQGSEIEAVFEYVCVQPGAPASFQVTSDETPIYYSSINKRKYSVLVKDKFGNNVQDGTVVDIDAVGDLSIESVKSMTENGVVTFDVVAMENYGAENSIQLSVGSFIYQDVPVAVEIPQIRLEIPGSIPAGGLVDFRVRTTPAVGGVDIFLNSDVGKITSLITTDSSGVAHGKLKANLLPTNGMIKANIGRGITETQSVAVTGDDSVSINTSVIIGDASQDGIMSITDDLGYQYNAVYLTGLDVEVRGQPGEVVNLALGTKAFPVSKQKIYFPMNLIFDGNTVDSVNGTRAQVYNIKTYTDWQADSFKAFLFGGYEGAESYLSLLPSFDLTLPDAWQASLKIKPDLQLQDANLVKIRDGVKLILQSDNRLRLDITSSSGTQTLTSADPVEVGVWTDIAVTYNAGTVDLTIGNNQVHTLHAVQTPQNTLTEKALEIGRGYKGLMANFGLAYQGSAANPLARFDDGSLQKSITIDSTGKAVVKVNSTGVLSAAGGYQRVDLDIDGKHYPFYLISKQLHKHNVIVHSFGSVEYANAVLDAVDIAQNTLFPSSVVEPAYALGYEHDRDAYLEDYPYTYEEPSIWGFLTDAESWRGMAEGLKTFAEEEYEGIKENGKELWDELKNGEFDEVTAAVMTLRVALMVPIARRYIGRMATPCIKFLKRYGNHPVGKHFANALNSVLKPLMKGDTDPLMASVYGLIFVGDLMDLIQSGDGAELVAVVDQLLLSVDSADDLTGIFSFARLSLNHVNPDCSEDMNLLNYIEADQTAWVDPLATPAYAASGTIKILKRLNVRTFIQRMKKALNNFDDSFEPTQPAAPTKPFKLSKVLRSIGDALNAWDKLPAGDEAKESIKSLLENTLDEKFILASMVITYRGAPGAITSLLTGKLPLRTTPIELIAAIAKIEESAKAGLLDNKNYELPLIGGPSSLGDRLVKWKIRDKYKNVFLNVVFKTNGTKVEEPTSYIAINKMNGDAFHLATIASLLADNQVILGVEAETHLQIKKTVLGQEKTVGKPLNRRVDIVTGDAAAAKWHEVKSLSFNTKKAGASQESKTAFKRALGTLDLVTITTIKNVKTNQLVVLGEDSGDDLKVKSNQFYTKEFFIDRVYAGANTQIAAERIRWVMQDYTKSDMNTYDIRSAANKRDLVVDKTTFTQCGINKSVGGTCASIYNGVDPLNVIRDKLVDGIRDEIKPEVTDILIKTFPGEQLDDANDVKAYLTSFSLLKSKIILSENSDDWLIKSPIHKPVASCKIP